MSAVTIDLGVVADSGYFAENPGSFELYAQMSPLHITDPELRMLLSAGMKGCTADGKPLPSQILAGVGKEYLITGTGKGDNKFLHLMCANESGGTDDGDDSALREAVSSSTSIRDAANEVRDALVNRLSRALMIEAADIDASQPLHAYGGTTLFINRCDTRKGIQANILPVDSLVAVDIRNWVFRELAADITVFDIISPMPISLLALKIASVSGLLPKELVAEQIEEVTKELNAAMPSQ